MDILEELKDVRSLISDNLAEAWNHDLSETSTAVILEDLTVIGDNEEVVTLTYNYWANKLNAIIHYMEDRHEFKIKSDKKLFESFVNDCISSGKVVNSIFREEMSDLDILMIEDILMTHSDKKAKAKMLKILNK